MTKKVTVGQQKNAGSGPPTLTMAESTKHLGSVSAHH